MSIRNIIDSNIIESAVSGMVIYFFGDWDFLLKAILVLVILDFITGWIKAIYHHNLSSDIGFKGVIKKIVIFSFILMRNEKNHIKPKNFILTSQILCDNISI